MQSLEEDYLKMSGIQHFSFCRRQWALIHVEQQWSENMLTAQGKIIHERAHDPELSEKRGNLIVSRGMAVRSASLGLSGECDAVEFSRDENGVTLHGREGKWLPAPVEYKRGKIKEDDCDRLQLAAQAIALEEMLCCGISKAYIFYHEIRRRETVYIDSELRQKLREMCAEMHKYFSQGYVPKVKPTQKCRSCSLKDICLPALCRGKSARVYIEEAMREETP